MIHPFATIGAPSQDRKAEEGEIAHTAIGARTTIREYASIHRGTADAGGLTSIGDDCLLLAYTHVAHNCRVGNHVTMSNLAQLAGHVVVEDHASVGAYAGVHQFVRIGRYAFVGGYAKLPRDLPPFMLADGNPPQVLGPNMVGLRRAGFSREAIAELKDAYKTLYHSEKNVSRADRRAARDGEDRRRPHAGRVLGSRIRARDSEIALAFAHARLLLDGRGIG